MLLSPVGLFAAIKYYKKGHVNLKAALYMGFLFTLFASISSKYATNLDEKKNKNYIRNIYYPMRHLHLNF